MMHNMALRERKSLVWWNINSCPIPPGYDPRQVGPRIVSVLKNSVFSEYYFNGSVTITAIGRLTHSPSSPGNDVLRELSSTGIALIHAHDLQTDLFEWIKKNPPPANIMIISGPTELEGLARTLYRLQNYNGYRIFLAYPQRDPIPAWLWKSFLLGVYKEWLWTNLLEDDMDSGSADNKQVTTRLVLLDKCSETGKSPWSCSICNYAGQSFEDFTTHLNSEEHAHFALDDLVVVAPKDNSLVKLHQLKEEKEVKTVVWWYISNCPIPHGFDPRQVGPRIVSALMNSRVSGPVTITAIGKLTHSPSAPDNDVLRELFHWNRSYTHLSTDLYEWTEKNPPPANIMIISGPRELEGIARTIYQLRNYQGYNVLLAYPQRHSIPAWLWESFLCGDYKEWLWGSLLADDMDSGSADNKQVTTRLVLQDKCSETGESPWFCSDCEFAAQSFEDFTTHLNSEDHAHCVLDDLLINPEDNPRMVKPHHLKKMSNKRKIEEVEVGEDTEEVEVGEDTEEVEVEEDTACLI